MDWKRLVFGVFLIIMFGLALAHIIEGAWFVYSLILWLGIIVGALL